MKKQLLNLLLIIILATLSFCTSSDKSEISTDTIASLLENIINPPSEYRTAPLWDWNEKINKEDIEFQLKEFKKGGLGGVFVHPRPGLVTEYLSEEWNEMYKFTFMMLYKANPKHPAIIEEMTEVVELEVNEKAFG